MIRPRSLGKAKLTLSLCARLSVPFLASMGGAMAQGCIFGSPGPSTVATGKLYVSGDPNYDQFFSELYQVQLPLGQGTDREAQNRARVSAALGIPQDSNAEQIADALDQRTVALRKAGLTLNVKTTGFDAGGTPAVDLIATGAADKPADAALLNALAQSLRDDAALIGDLRQTRPRIDRLKPQADALDPGIDVTFRKGGAPKKAEVRKNVVDAQRLIPLMGQRSTDLEQLAKDFVLKTQKVVGGTPAEAAKPAPAPETPAPLVEAPAPKKAPPKKAAPAAAPAEPKAAPAEAPPKPKAKPPSDDFEP